jgi:hypothetical protein
VGESAQIRVFIEKKDSFILVWRFVFELLFNSCDGLWHATREIHYSDYEASAFLFSGGYFNICLCA